MLLKRNKRCKLFYITAVFTLVISFVGSSLYVPQAQADGSMLPLMPNPGTRVSLSPAYTPAVMRGMTIDPKNPFGFNFLIDQGNDPVPPNEQKEYFQKLIKYFLAALTVPEDQQWVNLSPYEGNRIIEANFGKTEMGRDLLAQDYMLKQITSSLLYPEDELGRTFWQKVYSQAALRYGTTQIAVNTFNKVWIVPETAAVYEKGNTVLVVQSKLKVMLEEDYLSLEKHNGIIAKPADTQGVNKLGSQALREIILPALEKEVNEGKNFAQLRQIYSGMVLATWYKQALRKSILTQIYANKDKLKGIDLPDPGRAQQQIYQQYLKAFKKGVYNFIREEQDPVTQQMIPRKYFSGGFARGENPEIKRVDSAMTAKALTTLSLAGLLSVATVLLPSSGLAQTPQINRPAAIIVNGADLSSARPVINFEQANNVANLFYLGEGFLKYNVFDPLRTSRDLFSTTIKFGDNEVIYGYSYQTKIFRVSKDILYINENTILFRISEGTYLIQKDITAPKVGTAFPLIITKVNTPVSFPSVGTSSESGAPDHPDQTTNKIVMNYNIIMPRDAIDRHIDEIPKDDRPGIGFDTPLKDGDLPVKVGENAPMTIHKVTAFGAASKKLFIIFKDIANQPVLLILSKDEKTVMTTDFTKIPEDLRRSFGLVNPGRSIQQQDHAAIAGRKDNLGGIDLNSTNLAMSIKRDGNGVPLPLGSQDPAMLAAQGFIPVITDIRSAEGSPAIADLKALASP